MSLDVSVIENDSKFEMFERLFTVIYGGITYLKNVDSRSDSHQ
jgi:hypothetical protein